MLGFAPLSSVPLSSLPIAAGKAATGFISGGLGTPNAAYARTQVATGEAPSTQFGAPKLNTRVSVSTVGQNTRFGAPPKFGPNILQVVGNGADGETTFFDTSPYYRVVTRNGTIAKSTAQSRFGTGAISLTGASTANYLSLGTSKDFDLGGTPFTIEAQVYLNAYNANGGRLISAGAGTTAFNNLSTGVQWVLQTDSAGVQFTWIWYGLVSGTYGWYQTTLAAVVPLSVWKHVEVACDGATTRLFVEGAMIASVGRGIASKGVAETVLIGALNGDAAGATYAANAYIQQIRIRRDCLHTAAFTAPTAGLPSWIGELAGIAPTIQVPSPRSARAQPATGFTSVQFGTGAGTKQQRPTGFQTGNVGEPRIFPYSPPSIRSTTFGSPRLFPFHVAPGIHSTAFGAPAGHQYWPVVWWTPVARFGTPTTPTNRAQSAAGIYSARMGTPFSSRVGAPDKSRTGRAFGFVGPRFGAPSAAYLQAPAAAGFIGGAFGSARAQVPATSGASAHGSMLTRLGTPRAGWLRAGWASGFASGAFGAPNGLAVLAATGISPGAFGTAYTVLTAHALGFRTGMFGTPASTRGLHANPFGPTARFGLPKPVRSNTYTHYGFCATRLGQPLGTSRLNYRAAGFTAGALGSVTCHQTHRVQPVWPSCRLGTPLLKRTTQC